MIMSFAHFQFRERRDLLRRLVSPLLALALLVSSASQRQVAQSKTVGDSGATEKTDRIALYQSLLDLTSPWTVLCVAAHPDDEDGSTLTVLRRKYGIHTVSLFSTYGEGGQNAVGPELYEDLGVIRARETMAAAAVQGSEPHFLGMRDFGFSKSAEETFRNWGETEPLRRMVLQIRQLRPDVIITNHDTTSGHGHHQATGRLILQAFDAAADPKQFPEQLTQVSTWQPQRLFVRTGRGPNSQTTGTTAQQVVIDPNERDPERGTTYAQQALAALQQHATQGPWPKTVSPNGARQIRYNLVREAKGAPPLPANAKTPLDGMALPDYISSGFAAPTLDGKPLTEFVENRGAVLVSLINARKRGAFTAGADVVKLDPHRFQLMSERLDKALALAAGVSLTISSAGPALIPGMQNNVSASLANTGDTTIDIKRVELDGLGSAHHLDTADKLLPGTDTTAEAQLTPDKNKPLTVPSSQHLYDGRLFGEQLQAEADLEIEGAKCVLTATKWLEVAPAVEISKVDPPLYVSSPGSLKQKPKFNITLKNNLPTQFRGLVQINGQNFETGREVALDGFGTQAVTLEIRTFIPMGSRNPANSNLTVTVSQPESREAVTTRSVPTVFANARVTPNLRVGYLPSFDDTLQRSLAALGVEGRQLTVQEIQTGALEGFDTIIIDNRGYEAHRDLIGANDHLLKYVEDGGTLLVFYHKTNEWNPDANNRRPQLAPYPIILDDERVTEEDAPITFLQPRHPLLNFPNRITPADFANWIQERGLYFPKEWAPQYTALLSTNDKGGPPLKGGLLVARYGKGHYIYTSMVWYRQLRGGIPGGYRFFANLVSYGKRVTHR